MKQSLGLRMGQSLTMTPALQQAIRLLQLSSLDLQMEIQQVLDSNVMLEADVEETVEPEAGAPPETPVEAPVAEVKGDGDIPEQMPVDAEWNDVFDDLPAPSKSSASDDPELQDFLQANLHTGVTLREHLMEQLRLAPFDDPVEAEIALHIVDSINDDGYLENWSEIVVACKETLGASDAQLESVLSTVQEFDPSGVAARSLGECLRLQLLNLPARTPGASCALALIDKHLALLARRDAAQVSKATGLPLAECEAALAVIKQLQPHPGRPFQAHESNYVAPDVFVSKRNGRWKVSLNPEHMPRLRINNYYQSLVKRADTSRDQVTMKQHLQEARYFINSLEARNETLLRVAQCIVEEQRAFLEYGDEAMRPLVLRDIAEQLGIHESTVSRATANKYMLTPRGLYELKYFFSSHVQTTQGGVCSATAIQAMIKRMVAAEEPAKPLSDATLADLLLKEGIQVARRTVAKYREGLGIPPSHERKPPA